MSNLILNPTKDSELPTIPIYEGTSQIGDLRIRPKYLENLVFIEFKRIDSEQWTPMFQMVALAGQIAFSTVPVLGKKVKVFDPATNTISDLTTVHAIRDDSSLRAGSRGQDVPGEDVPKPPNPRD